MIYCCNRLGKNHLVIEDAILVCDELISDDSMTFPTPKQGYIAVADGVGGNQGGAEASRFVLNMLKNYNGTDIKGALETINSDLLTYSAATDSRDMATTLTGIAIVGDKRLLFHVGNTRAYAMQGRYLKQLTTDHTVYQWLKTLERHEEAAACNRNEIIACMGGGNPSLLNKLTVQEITTYRCMLFTSDGVHDYVDIDTLESVLTEDSFGLDKCNKLIDIAIANGSEDDLSVIIAEFE